MSVPERVDACLGHTSLTHRVIEAATEVPGVNARSDLRGEDESGFCPTCTAVGLLFPLTLTVLLQGGDDLTVHGDEPSAGLGFQLTKYRRIVDETE